MEVEAQTAWVLGEWAELTGQTEVWQVKQAVRQGPGRLVFLVKLAAARTTHPMTRHSVAESLEV